MPTYHYKCEQDGTMFELHQSIHDDPIEYCECGSRVSRVGVCSVSTAQGNEALNRPG